jgi:DNA-binding NarL/FixJ family response regulator
MTVRVLLVSDVPLYREGVARTLGGVCTIDVVGTAACAKQVLEFVHQRAPDIVLMDMAIPHALDVAREIAQTSDKTRVVALAIPEIDCQIIACAEAGVAGYVPRDGSVRDTVDIIEAVARGEARCSQWIVGSLLRRIAALAANRHDDGAKGSLAGLTAREAEILALLQEGLSNKMMARRLGIELATVKNHVHSVFCKLGLHRRAEAAVWAQVPKQKDGSGPPAGASTISAESRDLEPVH